MVTFIGTPSGPDVRAAMSAGLIDCMTTPAQGNVLPDAAAAGWRLDVPGQPDMCDAHPIFDSPTLPTLISA